MEKEKLPTGVLVYERTYGNVQVNVWANRRKSGHYSFRTTFKKLVKNKQGKVEYAHSFKPEDLKDLELGLSMVSKWYEHPVLIGEKKKEEQMVLRVPPAQPETQNSDEGLKLNEAGGFFSPGK